MSLENEPQDSLLRSQDNSWGARPTGRRVFCTKKIGVRFPGAPFFANAEVGQRRAACLRNKCLRVRLPPSVLGVGVRDLGFRFSERPDQGTEDFGRFDPLVRQLRLTGSKAKSGHQRNLIFELAK